MRRSKSDPAKYARNYRKISQRRMTQYDHIDEEKEIERLRSVLRNSEEHLRKDEEASSEKRQKNSSGKHDVIQNLNWEADSSMLSNELSIELSSELLVESGNTSAENPLVVLPSKKKKKKEKTVVQLTHEEIREAKSLQKKTARKLQQLETRAAQKKKRAELYKKLEQNKISKEALQLLQSSGKVSRKDTDTKKQTLQKLLNKERAGIKLNQEENDLLYPEKVVEDLPDNPLTLPNATVHSDDCKEAGNSKKKRKRNQEKVKDDNIRDLEKTYEKVGPRKEKSDEESTSGGEEEMECDVPPESKISSKSSLTTAQSTNNGQENKKIATASQKQEPQSGFDFATQMMASLSKLKSETRKKAEEVPTPANDIEEEERKNARPHKQYVPSEPTVLKTAATLGIRGAQLDAKRKVMPIKRPEPVENSRYDLPVSAMEFEIMDAIRNNDVTILCGETGSGKSTQVPQFLYEGGFSVNNSKPDAPPFLIGITQPRRVAAVSTAKRVCYEMGRGDGQSIKGSSNLGNLVAYRTRYETAGAGKETCVQFMTDGILLQEIQSDLLLRRYSVVVLDESHERNLNTDVLIGLLSVALPLRKKAAEEDPSIVPLKIVLMSATLRVEDFTKNEKLFPSCAPAVVTVQGRTHPVTIHHSKVTELEDYGKFNIEMVSFFMTAPQ